MRQPGHGPGCSVAKPSRTHSFTALVNHTAPSASVVRCRPRTQARRCGYDFQLSAANLITKPMGPNVSNTRIGSSVAAGSLHFVLKRHSEQSRAGVTDECFGLAAVGLEHLENADQ